MIKRLYSTLVLTALAFPASADPPILDIPIACALGRDCYIEDYFDSDPSENQSDYTCGIKSRNDHRGVDFVLLGFDQMADGVPVLAAAPGIVSATRDGMVDQAVTDETRPQIEGRECGNAVRIDHGDGWQTLYCHMAQGSVRVQQGERVDTGTPLGLVGLSGLTNFPHLHLGVLKDEVHVDPFKPNPDKTCGVTDDDGLWRDAPDYDPSGLFTAGFSTHVPSFDAVKSGAARVKSATSDQPIVLYAHAFYPQTGDTLEMTATGPKGEIFKETILIDDPKAQIFRAFGRRGPATGWPEGAYQGHVVMKRGDNLLSVRHAEIVITR